MWQLKKAFFVLIIAFTALSIFAQTNLLYENNLIHTNLFEAREVVTWPSKISTFIDQKEQQANKIAYDYHFELGSDFKNFFAAAKAGRAREAEQIYFGKIDPAYYSTELTPQSKSPLKEATLDAELAVEAFGEGEPNLMLALAREMTNSLPSGCIYFGGTDPGRGLPTMLCHSPGDSFFVVSQNHLADSRYIDYLRDMYGTRILLPTTNDFQDCYSNYIAGAQHRMELGQLRPGEYFEMKNGKPEWGGAVDFMMINALIAKVIFDKNPNREFYCEESFPLNWMYPHLSPHGLIMKLSHEPLSAIPPEEIQKDEDFWSEELANKIGDWLTKDTSVSNVCAFTEKVLIAKDLSDFKGNPKFIGDKYSSLAYSKMRTAIAGVYWWRLSPQCPSEFRPKNNSQRQQMIDAADFAFRQAFAIYPGPEQGYRYINFLRQFNRMDDALLIANTMLKYSPTDEQLKNLVSQLEALKRPGAGY